MHCHVISTGVLDFCSPLVHVQLKEARHAQKTLGLDKMDAKQRELLEGSQAHRVRSSGLPLLLTSALSCHQHRGAFRQRSIAMDAIRAPIMTIYITISRGQLKQAIRIVKANGLDALQDTSPELAELYQKYMEKTRNMWLHDLVRFSTCT